MSFPSRFDWPAGSSRGAIPTSRYGSIAAGTSESAAQTDGERFQALLFRSERITHTPSHFVGSTTLFSIYCMRSDSKSGHSVFSRAISRLSFLTYSNLCRA